MLPRRFCRALALALVLPLSFAVSTNPAAALDLGALSDDERAAFRAEVRAYLLDNPEVLIEAIGVLEERQAEVQATDDAVLIAVNAEAIFEDGHSWVGGNPDGDITLVEFVDYNCGFCKRAFPEVMELVEIDGNIRLVMKEFPILGPASDMASRFAVAVLQLAGDDAYAEAHERMMTLRGDLGEPAIRRIGTEMGLDMEAITERMDSPEVNEIIAENRALAQRLGISGTPTFVLGDRMLRGYLPLPAMQELVEELRAD